jgi:outer membrane protein OmpA-like peptidoglycan-associated protein
MKNFGYKLICLLSILLGVGLIQGWSQDTPPRDVISKSTRAVNYEVGGGSTKIDFKGTDLSPASSGEAKVEAKKGITKIEAKFYYLQSPTKWGTEFLTYVLWAVSPEGRSSNLGEILTDKNGQGKLDASTPLQVFSLVVTAEPYFAVSQPSEFVVLENEIRKDTKGRLFIIDEYRLMKRVQYQKKENPLSLTLDLKNVPLEMYQARNALEIAKAQQAERYAPEIFQKAQGSLTIAEKALADRKNKREIISTARQAVQFSEDARKLAVQTREEEQLANERKASQEAQRSALERAQQEELQRAKADAARLQAEADKAQAEAGRARAEAERALSKQKAEEEARMRAEADAARVRAEAEQAMARKAASEAQLARMQAEEEKAQLRAKLLRIFNLVLDTRDTERGLVINMSDVLFDTGKYTLRPEAREKLARLAGIVLNYPELKLEAEGHTDNTGSAEFNQKLSEQRAESVRAYLVSQGIPEASVSAVGRGFTMPVASNDTAAGRQQNRRVELIVSGEVIGTAIGNARQ